MFFNEEEMKVAEDLAWKMLDGWNHAYYPNLDDYAYFYYKDKVIMDPWMNEKGQGLLRPEWAPEITKKIKSHLGDNGRLTYTTTIMPVVVYFAMSDRQADEEHGYSCIE